MEVIGRQIMNSCRKDPKNQVSNCEWSLKMLMQKLGTSQQYLIYLYSPDA